MSEIRSLAQIQRSSQIQSAIQVQCTSKVNWLRSNITYLIRFFGTKCHNNMLRLRIHKRSKLLAAPLRGKIVLLLVIFDAQNSKSLRCSKLETISSALLNILCEDIFIFLLNHWQMYIKSTWLIFFLIFFNSSFCFWHFLNLPCCNLFHLLHSRTNLTKTTFFCVVNLNWLKLVLVLPWIVRWIRWRMGLLFHFFLLLFLFSLNAFINRLLPLWNLQSFPHNARIKTFFKSLLDLFISCLIFNTFILRNPQILWTLILLN